MKRSASEPGLTCVSCEQRVKMPKVVYKRDREWPRVPGLFYCFISVDFFLSLLTAFNTNDKGIILDTAREVIGL